MLTYWLGHSGSLGFVRDLRAWELEAVTQLSSCNMCSVKGALGGHLHTHHSVMVQKQWQKTQRGRSSYPCQMLLRHQVTQGWARDRGFWQHGGHQWPQQEPSREGREDRSPTREGQGMKRKRGSVDKKTDNSLQVVLLARGSKAVGNGWKG